MRMLFENEQFLYGGQLRSLEFSKAAGKGNPACLQHDNLCLR